MNWDAIKEIALLVSAIVLISTVGFIILLVLLNLVIPL